MDEIILHVENPKDSMKYPTKQILESNETLSSHKIQLNIYIVEVIRNLKF